MQAPSEPEHYPKGLAAGQSQERYEELTTSCVHGSFITAPDAVAGSDGLVDTSAASLKACGCHDICASGTKKLSEAWKTLKGVHHAQGWSEGENKQLDLIEEPEAQRTSLFHFPAGHALVHLITSSWP